VCLIFTGLEPCGEHKYWCVPKIGFTGRICTPSLLKNLVLPQGKNDFNIPATKARRRGLPSRHPSDKDPSLGTPSSLTAVAGPKPPGNLRLGNRVFPSISPPRLPLRTRAGLLLSPRWRRPAATPRSKDHFLWTADAGGPDKLLHISQSTGTNRVEPFMDDLQVW